MSIESVVRPAQSPSNQPPRQIRQRRSARNWLPVIHKIKASGNPQMGQGSVSQTVSYYHKRKPNEKAKISTTDLGFGGGLGITFP